MSELYHFESSNLMTARLEMGTLHTTKQVFFPLLLCIKFAFILSRFVATNNKEKLAKEKLFFYLLHVVHLHFLTEITSYDS